MELFVGNLKDWQEGSTYLESLMTGTNVFFANSNITEQQHVAGVKSSALSDIDRQKKVSIVSLEHSSTTDHQTFNEPQFIKLSTCIIDEIQIEFAINICDKVSFCWCRKGH